MKPVLTGLALLLSVTYLSAQSDWASLPTSVVDIFTLHYPDAENVQWTQQNEKFVANFKNDHKSTSMLLMVDGSILQTETEIRVVALPPEATSFLMDVVGVKKIDNASILEDEDGTITFKAFIEGTQFWFDAAGQPWNANGFAYEPR